MRVFLECGRCRGKYEIQFSCEEFGNSYGLTHILDHIDPNDCIAQLKADILGLREVYYETSRPLVDVIEFVNQLKLAVSDTSSTIPIPMLRTWGA